MRIAGTVSETPRDLRRLTELYSCVVLVRRAVSEYENQNASLRPLGQPTWVGLSHRFCRVLLNEPPFPAGAAICLGQCNKGYMGEVSRGVLALLIVLGLTGSLAPVSTVPEWSEDGTVTPSPETPDRSQRQTPVEPPSAGDADPLDRELLPAETVASRNALQTSDTIYLAQEFQRVPDRPGVVRVRLVYAVPDRIVSLRTAVPTDATVTDRNGFVRTNATHVRWDGTTPRPELSYELSVNETVERSDPQAASGRSLYADTANWSLFERPSTPTNWEATGRTPIQFERRSSTAGPGAAGQWIVFLGDHETHERTVAGQQFRLVVPRAANLSESPEAILDALANGSDALRVGDRDEQVFIVAAPTDAIGWGVRGLQTGDSDIWVRDSERLDEADSAWLHEYVHSRQSFSPTSRTLWFTEASASYYAALLSLEQDAIDFEAFRDRMRMGTWPVYDRAVLANVSTWTRSTDYDKGSLVAGQLDRRLRIETDREQTFQDVFRAMNRHRGPVSQLDLLNALGDAGGTGLLGVGQTYTETAANATMWNRTTHAAVFGQLPARIGSELPPVESSGAYRISGQYRNVTVAEREPVELVTGERLTVDAVVSNVGGTAGQYNLSMRVNGTVVNGTSGQIGASSTTTVPLSHRFPTPGTYVVAVDGSTVNVTVERPANARVVGLSAAQSQLRQGESVALTATVYNGASTPGEMAVVFTRNFDEVDRVRVTLGPNSTAFVTRRISLPTAGTVSLGAGSVQSVDVAVEPAPVQTTRDGTVPAVTTRRETATQTPRTTTATTTAAEGNGFGLLASLLAAVVAALIAVTRRRRRR